MLIKFLDSNYFLNFSQGNIFMHNLEYYRNEELKMGNNNLGDQFDGLMQFYSKDEHINLVLKVDGNEMPDYSNVYAFCLFYTSNLSDVKNIDIESRKKLRTFGDKAVIIKDEHRFIELIEEASIKYKYRIKRHLVHYYSPESVEDNMKNMDLLSQDMQNIAFIKRDIYTYQSEYRITFLLQERQENWLEIPIGDIKNIIEVVDSKLLLFEDY